MLKRIENLTSTLKLPQPAVRKLLQRQPALLQQPSAKLQQAMTRLQQLLQGRKQGAQDVIKAHPKVQLLPMMMLGITTLGSAKCGLFLNLERWRLQVVGFFHACLDCLASFWLLIEAPVSGTGKSSPVCREAMAVAVGSVC